MWLILFSWDVKEMLGLSSFYTLIVMILCFLNNIMQDLSK